MFANGLWAAAGILFIFAMTSLGAAAVFLFPSRDPNRMQGAMMGFAGGVMTAAAVWSLLIPAIEQTVEAGSMPGWIPAALGLVFGAAFIALLDLWRRGRETEQKPLLFAAVTLHNIPEGMAVGLAFALASEGTGLASALALAFGIGVQNFPEGAAVSLPLRHCGMGRCRAFSRGVLSGAVEPVSAGIAMLIAARLYPAMPWLLSFSAGAMLYVSVHELLREARGIKGSFGYVFGFILMMALDVALG